MAYENQSALAYETFNPALPDLTFCVLLPRLPGQVFRSNDKASPGRIRKLHSLLPSLPTVLQNRNSTLSTRTASLPELNIPSFETILLIIDRFPFCLKLLV